MDIYFYARAMKEDAMAEAARIKAEQIMNRCSSRSSSGTGTSVQSSFLILYERC
jgi:hypothetical protein